MHTLADPLLTTTAVATADARAARGHRARVAGWLRQVWAGEPAAPAFTWDTLPSLPEWALGTPAQLERLALLCGALLAAPALRVCLDAGPLLRVRALIGADALDRVLAVPGMPPLGAPWKPDEGSERDTLHAWGCAVLLSTLADPALRASLARMLSVVPPDEPAMHATVACRMVALVQDIQHRLDTARRPEEALS